MGWCREFGARIADGCDHPMVAHEGHCACAACGATCTGRFDACPQVWAAGPKPVLWRSEVAGPPAAPSAPAAALRTPLEPAVFLDDQLELSTALQAIWSELQAVARTVARQQEGLATLADALRGEVAGLREEVVRLVGEQHELLESFERVRRDLAALTERITASRLGRLLVR